MHDFFKDEYKFACETPSDINQHIPVLYNYAKNVDHITEMGVRTGVSTRAFLLAAYENNTKLTSYDIQLNDIVEKLFQVASYYNSKCTYVKADTLKLEIEETDLLFIDTDHTYEQLKGELKLHGNKARNYIIFHDTVTFPMLNIAIDEFLADNRHWQREKVFTNNNGLTVLKRSS